MADGAATDPSIRATLADDETLGAAIRRACAALAGPSGRLERAAVLDAVREAARRDGTAVEIGLPQDPGQAGRSQIMFMTQELAGYRVNSSPETGKKMTRATPVAALLASGCLTMRRAEWNGAFLDEIAQFPNGSKDDQVDALSRAFMTLVASAAPARRMHVPLLSR